MSDQNVDSASTANQTVLIVDDEQGLADLYAHWLEDRYTVCTAYNGRDALETLNKNIEVVLLDRRMPGMSGDEVLNEIRRRDLPCRIALVTAVEPDFDIIEMGFDDYITKPVSKEQLRDVVDSLRSRRQYDAQIQELFSLISKKKTLEAEKSDADLATNEEYTALVDQIAELQSSFDKQAQSFDDVDFRASFLSLESTQINQELQEIIQQNQADPDGPRESNETH